MATYAEMVALLQAKADARSDREAQLHKFCADVVARLTGLLATSQPVIQYGVKDQDGVFQPGKVGLTDTTADFSIGVAFSINATEKILFVPVKVKIAPNYFDLGFDVYAAKAPYRPSFDPLTMDTIAENIGRVIDKEFPKLLAQSFR